MKKILIVIVIVVVVAGIVIHEFVFRPGSLIVIWNFPPAGSHGGRYVYLVTNALENPDPAFNNIAIKDVEIINHIDVQIGNAQTSEEQWAVQIPAGSKIVDASGAPTPWVAVRFDDIGDVSYTLREMNIKFQYDYVGWLATYRARNGNLTLLVPVPYTQATTEPQTMDDSQYRSYWQDISQAIRRWYPNLE